MKKAFMAAIRFYQKGISRPTALYFRCMLPVWVKMWVKAIYDAKEGRISDMGSPSRCALSRS